MYLASRSMPPKSRFALQGRRRSWGWRAPLTQLLGPARTPPALATPFGAQVTQSLRSMVIWGLL